ncbi:pyrroline-5-carboxylate reductase [Salipaludibacillus keqinensis]|uniref:Pyrroline-5-carboxylate reductase n=1 Tax=Salipaludibacillus keqinensis TaxID=2045207 RepID=A0A323TNW0_9BACI|nr:pyrroline-5-carboxylate reductase [Salipaludibacillus keqinensis]PYZ94403.1 pyrroline-5-carboxylate reductase [Salipaludibacillus keqinensis]
MNFNLTIIGAGSMAEALIAGWLKSNSISPENIMVTNRSNDHRLDELTRAYQVKVTRNQESLLEHGQLFILACKPKDWKNALLPFKQTMKPNTPLISVMAGITVKDLEEYFPHLNVPVIRAIPNTSAVVNASMTPYALGAWVTQTQKNIVEKVFTFVGEIAEVPESQMDAMTALTGTGPAYIYYLMESMEMAAEKIGIDKTLARHLVSQTLLGASLRVQTKELSPSTLYHQIMSPGGTTEAGFNILREHEVQETMIHCIEKAYGRSKELGDSCREILTDDVHK